MYGLPLSPIDVIRKLYENWHIQLKLRSALKNVPYEAGVQQGNNMAHILFLFMMQAVMQTLEKSLPSKLEYRFFPNDKGCLLGQRTQSAGAPFNHFSLLFIDDGAFICKSRKEIEDAAQTIHDHLTKFGLQMHISSSMTM